MRYVDCSAKASQWAYDERGQLVQFTDAAGNVTRYRYDAGQLAAIRHADNSEEHLDKTLEERTGKPFHLGPVRPAHALRRRAPAGGLQLRRPRPAPDEAQQGLLRGAKGSRPALESRRAGEAQPRVAMRLHVVWLGRRHARVGKQDRRRGWLRCAHHALRVRAGQFRAGGAGGARRRHRTARPARVRRLLPAGRRPAVGPSTACAADRRSGVVSMRSPWHAAGTDGRAE
ncbi:RHS repeat protein [Burkholderia cepacia]|nr:RHS repeat protein [Burkholderia cepacia]